MYAQSVPSNPSRCGNNRVLHTLIADLMLPLLSSANSPASNSTSSFLISRLIMFPLSALLPGPGSSKLNILSSSNPKSIIPVMFIKYCCHCSAEIGAHEVDTILTFAFLDFRRLINDLIRLIRSLPPKDVVKFATGSNGVPSSVDPEWRVKTSPYSTRTMALDSNSLYVYIFSFQFSFIFRKNIFWEILPWYCHIGYRNSSQGSLLFCKMHFSRLQKTHLL